ncbi:hypothetical protein [Streptomyces sp. NPDC050504]|uniref:hypothetical protein n=1 Tax=Streptomyces sp. NPDC050504 TaxID=3365618 RepID=UPI00379BC567
MRGSAPVIRMPSAAARTLALCAGLALALSACSADEDPDEGTNGVGKLSATQIEEKARAAADGADAVRLSGTLVSKGGTYKLNMRLKEAGATGSVASKDATFELLRIEDELYLKADAAFWTHQDEGGSGAGQDEGKGGPEAADKLDDKYVKVPEDDPAYKRFRGFTDKKALLAGLLDLHGEAEKGDRGELGGVRTIQVKGGEEGDGGTLSVALEGIPYPLQFARGGGAGVLRLSDWALDFPLAAPREDDTVDYEDELPKSKG